MVKSRPHKHKPSVAGTAAAIAQGLEASAWQRLSAGEGTKGPRMHDWADCELADLEAAEDDAGRTGLWTRGLLIRRTIGDGDLAFFSTWCPAGTAIATLMAVEGASLGDRGRVRDAKIELGLDHCGFLFSLNAARPSRASWVWASRPICPSPNAIASSKDIERIAFIA